MTSIAIDNNLRLVVRGRVGNAAQVATHYRVIAVMLALIAVVLVLDHGMSGLGAMLTGVAQMVVGVVVGFGIGIVAAPQERHARSDPTMMHDMMGSGGMMWGMGLLYVLVLVLVVLAIAALAKYLFFGRGR